MPEFVYCPRCARTLVEREESGLVRRACPENTCGFIFYDNPIPVVAALVEYDGAVVLVRSHGWPADWYGLVTGFLERGEAADAGALREVKEELGLDGRIVRLIGVYPFERMNQIIIAYHVAATGTLALGDELAGHKLVPPDRLRPWRSGTGDAVADWLASRSMTR
jgi:ADP-ribose pyrophosphatase YjhB (NUDIX family)